MLQLSPIWEPAKRNGKPISVDLKLPLDFKTNEVENAYKNKEVAAKRTSDSLKYDNLLKTSKEAGVETKPNFVGGPKAFYKYIASSFNPPSAREFKGGKLIIQFIVEKDGSLTDFKVLQDIGFGTAQEAIRVLKNSPKWIPGMQKGIPVRVMYTLPISLKGN